MNTGKSLPYTAMNKFIYYTQAILLPAVDPKKKENKKVKKVAHARNRTEDLLMSMLAGEAVRVRRSTTLIGLLAMSDVENGPEIPTCHASNIAIINNILAYLSLFLLIHFSITTL